MGSYGHDSVLARLSRCHLLENRRDYAKLATAVYPFVDDHYLE